MKKIQKIIIVDDHALYRLGISTVIREKIPYGTILAEYSSGQELLLHLATGTEPDILLLDIIMPEITGIDLAKIIKEDYPNIKILILSSEVETKVIMQLLDIGVNGYLSKLTAKDDLVKAIESIAEGNLFYGQDISRIIYDTYIAKNISQKEGSCIFKKKYHPNITLTKREIEVVELLCEGLLLKEVADRLCLSKRTIENHKANIMGKLGFHSIADLVKYAIKEGIVIL